MQRHACPRCRRTTGRIGCALLVTVSASTAVWAAAERPPAGRAVGPVEPAPRARTHRIVFTCIEPGLVTFADKPCGPSPQVRDLPVDPGRVRPATSPTPQDGKSAGPDARKTDPPADTRSRDDTEALAAAEAHAQTCARLTHALRELDARMRAGYSAREAGRLWDRWREARERAREAGC